MDYNDFELLDYIAECNEEAKEILVKKYTPMIYNIIGKYKNIGLSCGLESNGLFQEGLIGLNSAINSFNNKKDFKFSTYATVCIENSVKSRLRLLSCGKHSLLNNAISLDLKVYDDSQEILENILICENGTSILDDFISKEELSLAKEFVFNNCSKLENKVFNLRIKGFTNKEIGKKLNIKDKTIDNAVQRIKRKFASNKQLSK
ncbi:MAG: sigma-70 family RNA polymerase sigma factor [Bacilli bacterium]